MKPYPMTDLEGVAGVLTFKEWTGPRRLHCQVSKELLTRELNAAVDGFFEEPGTEVLIARRAGLS